MGQGKEVAVTGQVGELLFQVGPLRNVDVLLVGFMPDEFSPVAHVMDDVRVYNYAISAAEIAKLAGAT